jgi:hypothetical protein
MATAEPFATEATAASAHLPSGPAQPRWRLFDRLVVAGFVVGLLLPGLVMATGRRPAAIENRPLLTAPPLTAASLLGGTWTTRLDAFLADNVYFRPWAIRLRGELEWATGGTGTREVVRGTDGWLYLGQSLDPACLLSADDVLAELAGLSAAFEANGQDFRFVAIPDKQSIYPEHVALGWRPTACVERDRATLRAGIPALAPHVIDGWSALEAARSTAGSGTAETPVFFRKDSHWTPTGAAAVIRALVSSIDPALWDEADVDRSGSASYAMDLGRLMGIRRREQVARVVMRPGMKVAGQNLVIPLGLERTVFTDTATGTDPTVPGRTLIIYDSFFGKFPGLVAPFFAQSTWVHVDDVVNQPELAAALGRFDRVVFARVERNLYQQDYAAALSRFIR